MKTLAHGVVVLIFTIASLTATGGSVVVPVAAFAIGANGAMWATEMRVTNLSGEPRTFRVLDWVGRTGNLPFQAQEFTVGPGSTQTYGAWSLISPSVYGIVVDYPTGVYFGAVVLDVDPALLVQTAVLTGVAFTPCCGPGVVGYNRCAPFNGGYDTFSFLMTQPGVCNEGAGPLIDGTAGFFTPGQAIFLPWLHTDASRRTNLTFYNPDPVLATVTITVTPADGTLPISVQVTVLPHDVTQLNDVFSVPPLDGIRGHNVPQNTAAARATIRATTRLFAVAWVISNQNNTVTISLPR